jgi:F420-dependent oxidoreductase-like protein
VRFGVHAGLQYTTTGELRALWRQLEDDGYDWISIWDHFYAADATGAPDCLEAVSMHAALACDTQRVLCGSLVYSIGYRHPAVLAKALATIDQLSGGRAALGIGAGWLDLEYRAYGMPFPPVRERLAQLEEGIQCIRGLLTNDTTTFKGEYFTLDDARCEPKPVQARLPIWIGGAGEKVTVRLAAQYADGWNVPYTGVDDFARKMRLLDEHCERLGRDPATVTKSVNVAMARDEDDLKRQFGLLYPMVRPSALLGSTQAVVDAVGGYLDAGAEWIILAVRAPFDPDALAQFARDVAPGFSPRS